MGARTSRIIAVLAISGFLGCGADAPGEQGVEPVDPPTPVPSPGPSPGPRRRADPPADPPADPLADPLAGPQRPERVFDRSRPADPPWYREFARRLSPAKDGDDWPTELVAPFIEQSLERALGRLAEGDLDPARALLAGDVDAGGLSPSSSTTLRDDAGVRVLRGAEFDAPLAGPEAGLGVLRALVEPFEGATELLVKVDVVACTQLAGASFDTVCHARIQGRLGPAAVQVNARFEAQWLLQKRPVMRRLRPRTWERVDTPEPVFVELTRHVLSEDVLPRDELMRGGIEYALRHDRMVPFTNVYLGMHGAALGDFDRDGLEDLYVARQGGRPNHLFRTLPDRTVVDVAPALGVDLLDDTGGVLILDLDGDGWRDLLLGVAEDIVIFWNDAAGGFQAPTHLHKPGGAQVYSISAADADGDGDLDLYDTRYFRGDRSGGAPTPYHDARNGAPNVFWRNEGQRTLVDGTRDAGLDDANDRFSLAALWEDLDSDGDLDLYVTNDFGRNNLYVNDGGHFQDAAEERGALDMAAGMGITCADVDRDGHLDLYISNMHAPAGERVIANPRFQARSPLSVRAAYQLHARGNTLLLADGAGGFRDESEKAANSPGGWAWGATFIDYDADGYSDLFVPNGFATGRHPADLESFFWRVVVGSSPDSGEATPEYLQAWQTISNLSQLEGLSWNGHERDYGYLNLGGARFADASAALGLDFADDGRVGLACDWDGDGRLDLWIKNRTAPLLRFVHNRFQGSGNWISLELEGARPNTEAIGALVHVHAGADTHVRRVYAGEGYLGGGSKRRHFGLGSHSGAVQVEVRWPDGSVAQHAGLAPGRVYAWRQGAEPRELLVAPRSLATAAAAPIPPAIGPLVSRVPALATLPYGALELPAFDGLPRRVAEFSGSPLLLVCFTSWHEGSRTTLADLAAYRSEYSSAGVRLWPMSVDRARDHDAARSAALASGLEPIGGRADRRARKLLEVAVGEVLGPFDDLPLPVALLFDADSQLVCVYLGELDPATVLADARAITAEGPVQWPTALTGGRWLAGGPRRNLRPTADWLRRSGENALADELSKAAAQRE